MTTIVTALDMAAKGSGPADLDRTHDAAFSATEVSLLRLTISVAVVAEDIRHLQF